MLVDLRKTYLDQLDASERTGIKLSLQSYRVKT
jgi:hypothetical protein